MSTTQLMSFIKNGFYIHAIHAFLHYITNNTYLSTILSIKLYSVNYFYWYGNYYSYLPNPRYNWTKQFIRFTDTGHLASVLPLVWPAVLPVAHNVHFVIMAGYWIGKLAFGLKDADRLGSAETGDIVDWHMDFCTYVHHLVPYLLIHTLSYEKWNQNKGELICAYEYSNKTLLYSYLWLYCWFVFIYIPWRFYTGDSVYSILDLKQTSKLVALTFVGFIHLLLFLSNLTGYSACQVMHLL
jgi:hypothetical protein